MGLDVDWERNYYEYSESEFEYGCRSLHVFTTATALFWRIVCRDRTTDDVDGRRRKNRIARSHNATTTTAPPATATIGPGSVVGSEYGLGTRLSPAQNDSRIIFQNNSNDEEGNILRQS